MAKSQKTSVGRRGFLKNAAAGAAGAAALVTTTPLVEAQTESTRSETRATRRQCRLRRRRNSTAKPGMSGRRWPVRTITRPGSDLMVQTVRDLGIEYVAANPGSSFEGLQESFINYGNPPNRDAGVHHRAA